MPRPVEHGTAYRPALDGVRALAVALVIFFHLGLTGFQGGLLGVGVFFTLSGYLITGLLLATWRRRQRWDLPTFWLRRARRLLPAVIMVLAVCMAAVLITDPADRGRRAVQALSALFYMANWYTIFAGDSYFTQVHGPGPFDHLWSLSVEEQFYLVWPLLLALLVALFRARMKAVVAVTAVLTACSFVVLALLAQPGIDNTRAYEGTDARTGGLLVGACLALLWPQPGRGLAGRARGWWPHRATLDALGLAGLLGIGWLVTHTNENTLSLYRWGLLLLSICTAGVLAAVAHPQTLLSRVCAAPPLRWLGERSYGLYLWHLPVIVFTPAAVLATHPAVRDVLQVAIVVVVAALSWHVIEDPIRTHGLTGALRAAGAATLWRPGTARVGHRAPGLVVGVSVFMPVALLTLLSPSALPHAPRSALAALPAPPRVIHTEAPGHALVPAPAHTTPGQPLRTRCTSVILVGDSTSEGLYGADSSLAPEENLRGQLQGVGVRSFTAAISGARSIIESYEGQPSGEDVVKKYVHAGYRGCWIIALGNVDAATVAKYAPDTASIPDRIDTIMKTIPADAPVMWMTTRTIRNDGDFRESVYPPWNQGLVRACGRYPNMRVFDWASAYKTAWIGPDGIHATTAGYRHKATLMAHAMAISFPATGESPDNCLVTVQP